VVVNYRDAAQTLHCVERLRRSRYDRLHIIVVDNASGDGSEPRLPACLEHPRLSPARSGRPPLSTLADRSPRFAHTNQSALPRAEVIACAQNLGFAAGANAGIRRALAAGAEMVWLLTPDVQVEPQTLPRLVEEMQRHAQLGICGPVIRAGARSIVGCRMWPRLGYYTRLRTARPDKATRMGGLLPTDYVDGGCLLVRSRLLSEIGLLREDFFLYYEDAELCLRARRAGWGLAIVGTAWAHTRPLCEDRNQRTFFLVRNSLWLARLERRFVLRTAARHLLQAAWHAWRHIWTLHRPSSRNGLSSPESGHARAAGLLRAAWQGVRKGLARR